MKILKIIFISLFVLIVVLTLAVFIFIKTFDINRFKPQIISAAGKALGRQVNFDRARLDISLMRGINLNVSNLAIADDPAFSKGDFLSVKNISLALDAPGYIFQKKIKVPNILIDSPRVNIIRRKDGSINAQSIAWPAKVTPQAAPLAIPAFFVSYLKGIGGAVNFTDNSFEPPINLGITDLVFSVSKISLVGPFPFVVEAAVLSAKKDLRIEGKVRVSFKNTEAVVSGLKVTADLSELSQDKIAKSFPMAKGIIFPQGIKGKVELQSPKFSIGPNGPDLQALSGNLSGVGDIFIAEARLKDINMLRLVLDKISVLPDLASKLEDSLPEKYRDKMSQKDTVLSDIKIPITIMGGRMVIKDASFGAEGFMFKGKGEAGFDAAYSLEGSFLIPQDLSAAIVEQAPPMQYLLNSDKQIYIPLKISGRAGAPKFNLDAEYIAKRLMSEQVKGQISNLLDKFLGGKKEGPAQEGAGAAPDVSDDKAKIKKAIGSVLSDIFK